MKLISRQQKISFDSYFRALNTDVQLVLYRSTSNMIWDSVQREPITQVLLEKLERRASLDALAALIAIVVEADLLGR
ncbi:hypothetical protein O6482_24460, partial [Salmonella enterica subsp. enterica]